MMGELEKITGRLPLVIENILGLKRRTSTYKEAINLYQEHRGDGARAYLFEREYDALGTDNRARHVLAALSVFEEPIEFEQLVTILKFDPEQVSDAIGELSDIFLNEDDEASNKFSIRPVARPFVSKAVHRLDRFALIEARAKHLKATSISNSPEVGRLRFRVDELLRSEKVVEALRIVTASNLPFEITEHPVFQALRGTVCCVQSPPLYETAREAFHFAFKAGLRSVEFLRAWYYMELHSGFGLERALSVCNLVIEEPNYSHIVQSEFIAKKAQVYRAIARAHAVTDQDRTISSYMQSVRHYLQSMSIRTKKGFDTNKSAAWCEEVFSEFIDAAVRYRRPYEVLDFMKGEIGGPYEVGPLVYKFVRFLPTLNVFDRKGEVARLRGALGAVRSKLQSKSAVNLGSDEKASVVDAIDSILKRLGAV
jgi:hypothetical protein